MTIVNRSIRADGLILKPSRPIAMPDFRIFDIATYNGSYNGYSQKEEKFNDFREFETWSVVSGIRFGIIMVK